MKMLQKNFKQMTEVKGMSNNPKCPFCGSTLRRHHLGKCMDSWVTRLLYPSLKIKYDTKKRKQLLIPVRRKAPLFKGGDELRKMKYSCN